MLHFAPEGFIDIGNNYCDCRDKLERTRLLPEALCRALEPSQMQQGWQAQRFFMPQV